MPLNRPFTVTQPNCGVGGFQILVPDLGMGRPPQGYMHGNMAIASLPSASRKSGVTSRKLEAAVFNCARAPLLGAVRLLQRSMAR
jgi:hypothetical protein